MEKNNKPKIVFNFVEAGLGHIMPMTAVYNAFCRKYGDKTEIVKSYFFQDAKNPKLEWVEKELITEVKKHNRQKGRGAMQIKCLDIFGQRIGLKFLYCLKYGRGYKPAIKQLEDFNADLIFNTHFATLYYCCSAKRRGIINSKIYAYCPDPKIAKQWDNRADGIFVSSAKGAADAKAKTFKNVEIGVVPFLIRDEVKNYDQGREYYRKDLGLPTDNFTVLAHDGAYGAGKLEKTVNGLIKSNVKMTVIAVCGKNEELYKRFLELKPNDNITFVPIGFTDKMIEYVAACDMFIGKAGASSLAEPAYFKAPQIVNFCATPIEEWICAHHVDYLKTAIKVLDIEQVVKTTEEWAKNPEKMQPYVDACAESAKADGAEILADILYEKLTEKR